MANNYCEFSFLVSIDSKEEEQFFRDWQEKVNENDDPNLWEDIWGVNVVIEDLETVWIYSGDDSCGSIQNAARLVADFQDQFKKTEPVMFEWADYCSKPRIGEFGGGAVVIKEGVIAARSTRLLFDDLIAEVDDAIDNSD